MKDAKGHGSNSRGGQQLVAAWRAAHQQGIAKVPSFAASVKAFAKDTSGHGRQLLHETPADPDQYNNLLESHMSVIHDKFDPTHLVHLAHFLH